jgi:hypothetical protein
MGQNVKRGTRWIGASWERTSLYEGITESLPVGT